jgi:hypothetical protein
MSRMDPSKWHFQFPVYALRDAFSEWCTPEINGEKHLAIFTSLDASKRFIDAIEDKSIRLEPTPLSRVAAVDLLRSLLGRVEWVCCDFAGSVGEIVARFRLFDMLAACEAASPTAGSLSLSRRLR